VHALLSTLHVLFHPVDVVHYFTTGTSIFAPLPRLLGMKTVCSVDGTDWQRRKWGASAQWYLRLSERLAAWFCDGLVADSREVMRYYGQRYRVGSFLIGYGMRESKPQGREWLERFGLGSRQYVLFVGRLVPENNIHHLIKAFERIRTEKKLVIVGNDPWEREHVRSLKSTSCRSNESRSSLPVVWGRRNVGGTNEPLTAALIQAGSEQGIARPSLLGPPNARSFRPSCSRILGNIRQRR
jgi:glycosyltransferase involved in cell wall biosynthesis